MNGFLVLTFRILTVLLIRFSCSGGRVDALINCPSVLAKFLTADLTSLNELCSSENLVRLSTEAEHNCSAYP